MANYGKWVGGALGWAFGGPIGAALGFFMGMMFDDNSMAKDGKTDRESDYTRFRHKTKSGDFAASLIVLSAEVMKADGKVLKSELNFVREFFVQNFGKEVAEQQVLVLRELLKQELNTRQICEQIRFYMEHPNRLLLLQYLFGIALADGDLSKEEVFTIRSMAHYMGISNRDFESIYAMFGGRGGARRTSSMPISDAYTILEINEDVDDASVKKAYRRMAAKYHPDKNRNLGEEHVKHAQEKFVKVSEAYERIKKARNMK